MVDRLKLSVVLATYNRAETLRDTLRHLADQELDPTCYEVIVIDDGSPDHTRKVVEEALPVVPFKMTYLHHANRGPGYTQNRGIRLAQAPIVLLMADDILMSRQALSSHLATHQAHPEPGVAVLGQVLQSPRLTQNVFLRTWDPFRFSGFAGLTELPYYRFWACNISVKRDFVLANGLFREPMGRAGPAAHEDPALGYQLHKAGLRILYCTEALGHHYHVVTFEQACKRRYQQGLNFGEFRTLVPEPEIPVAYHVLTWGTIGDHFRAWFGPRRQYLSAGDRNPITVVVQHLVRGLAFNRLTVRFLWNPLLAHAEHSSFLAGVVNSTMYRGTTFYHFLRGCWDGQRKFGKAWPADGLPSEASSG